MIMIGSSNAVASPWIILIASGTKVRFLSSSSITFFVIGCVVYHCRYRHSHCPRDQGMISELIVLIHQHLCPTMSLSIIDLFVVCHCCRLLHRYCLEFIGIAHHCCHDDSPSIIIHHCHCSFRCHHPSSMSLSIILLIHNRCYPLSQVLSIIVIVINHCLPP